MRTVKYMAVADRVLSTFTRLFGKSVRAIQEGELAVQSYRNGRENGYTLTLVRAAIATSARAVTFAENRNSDDIVIYPGDMHEMDAVNVDRSYAFRTLVKPGDYERAARVVARLLNVKNG